MSTESTTTYADLDALIGHPVDLVTEDVPVGGGRFVKVRGLSRYELLLNAKGVDQALVIERRNLATCLVEPKLTEEQVERWQKASAPGVIGEITNVIRRLSGMGEGAAKSGVPGDGPLT